MDVLNYTYHSHVTVIGNPPRYSVAASDGTFFITVYGPASAPIRQLSQGEMFVLKPTAANPDGIAGQVRTVAESGSDVIITARKPETLYEIFEEFDFHANLDILALADEIVIGEDIMGVSGFEIVKNPNSRVTVRAINANIAGIQVNGTLSLYRPTLHVSLNRFNVEYFVVRTGAEVDFTSSARVNVDRVFTLMRIPVWVYGVRVDVAFGLRFTVDGHFHLEVTYSINAEFGLRNGRLVASITPSLDYNFEFEARASVSRNIQARASVLSIDIYGVEGNFGRGVHTNSAMQAICPEGLCFALQTFQVRTVGSLDWGLLGRVSALMFFDDLERGVPATFRFRHGGDWHDDCPHGGTHVDVVFDGERFYLETDIFSTDFAVRRHPQDGPRTMSRMTFNRGISSIWNGIGGGWITYDINGRGFTHISGIFGKIDTGGLSGQLVIYADGVRLFSYTMWDDFHTPRVKSVELPPSASQVRIGVLASTSFTANSEFGFMNAFFVKDPNFTPPANPFEVEVAAAPRVEPSVITFLEQDIFGELDNLEFSSVNQFSRNRGVLTNRYRLVTAPEASRAIASMRLGSYAYARYDVSGRGYTTFSGRYGFVGGAMHGQRSYLFIYADGARLGTFGIIGRLHGTFWDPITEPIHHVHFDVALPPGTQIVEIVLSPVTNVGTALRSWVGIGDAFFGR